MTSSTQTDLAGDENVSALFVANISPPAYLWTALGAVAQCKPSIRNGILIVFSGNFKGRIGIFCNRFISGAMVDGTGESGMNALGMLLSQETGLFGFRACLPGEGLELKQDLNVDLSELLAMHEEAGSAHVTPADALLDGGAKSPELAAQLSRAEQEMRALEQRLVQKPNAAQNSSEFASSDHPALSPNIPQSSSDTALSDRPVAPPLPPPTQLQSAPQPSSDNFPTDSTVPHVLPSKNAAASAAADTAANSATDAPSYLDSLSNLFGNDAVQSGSGAVLMSALGDAAEAKTLPSNSDDSLKAYKQLVDKELDKVAQIIERSQSEEASASADGANRLEEVRFFNEFLQSEQSRVERWSREQLDAIRTPGKGGDASAQQMASSDEPMSTPSDSERSATQPQPAKAPAPSAKAASAWSADSLPKLIAILFAAVALLLVGVFEYSLQQRDRLVAAGVQALKANKPDDAVASFSTAIVQSPKQGLLYLYRAMAYSQAGKQEKSLLDIQAAESLNASNTPTLLLKASLEAQVRDYDKAIDDCTKVIAKDPNNVTALTLRADAALLQKDFKKSTADYTAVLKSCTDSDIRTHIMQQLAAAESGLQRGPLGEEQLTGLLKSKPTEWVYIQRGDAYRQSSQYSKAIGDYSKAIELNPRSYPAYLSRGICQARLHQTAAAIKDVSEALNLNKRSVEALIQRGSLYISQNNFAAAAEDLQKATQLNPYTKETKDKLAIALQHTGKPSPIAAAAAKELKADLPAKLPSTVKELLMMGYHKLQDGDTDMAVACFVEAAKKDPNSATVRKYLGYSLAQQGNWADGAKQLEAYGNLEPLDPNDIMVLSRCLVNSGRGDDAISYLRALTEKRPDLLRAQAELAEVYYAKGFRDEGLSLCIDGAKRARTDDEREMFDDIIRAQQARTGRIN